MFFGQRMENGRKVPSSINGEQIFNIFKQECFRPFCFYNSCNIKEKCSPCVIEAFFETCLAKRNTWKSPHENIVVGNIKFINLCNITSWYIAVVCVISLLCKLIPFTRENNVYCTCLIKAKSCTADACEQINHTVSTISIVRKRNCFRKIKNCF